MNYMQLYRFARDSIKNGDKETVETIGRLASRLPLWQFNAYCSMIGAFINGTSIDNFTNVA